MSKLEDKVTELCVVVGVMAISAIFILLFNWPLMWAINWLFSSSFLMAVFGVQKIGFVQTYVLACVCSYLFKTNSVAK